MGEPVVTQVARRDELSYALQLIRIQPRASRDQHDGMRGIAHWRSNGVQGSVTPPFLDGPP
jgi:hypothetical protein